MIAILVIQIATFAILGALFLAAGNWRLGGAQILLAGVQSLVFSGGIRP